MTIPQISPSIEKPFRDALERAIRNEIEGMHDGLLRLTDEQIVSCLNLCAIVAGYIAIDVSGSRWPDEEDLRQIGEAAPKSDNAQAFGLRAEDAYAYVKRVALDGEPLIEVLPPIEHASTLSFVITGQLLLTFRLPDEHWWEYLNRIEEAWEVAEAADVNLLPALMLRARRSSSPAKR